MSSLVERGRGYQRPNLQGSNIGGEFLGSFLGAVKSGVQPLAQGIAAIDPVSRNLRQQADASRLQAQQRLITGARSRPQDAKRLLGIAQQIGQGPTAQEQYTSTLPTNAQILGSGAKTAGYVLSGGLGAGNIAATAGFSLGLGQLGRQQGETFSQAGGRTLGEILPYSGLAQQITTPLISSGLSRFAPGATGGGLLGRFAQGGANVVEGGALNLSTGQALSPSQTAIDFITGVAGQPFGLNTPIGKSFDVGRNTKTKWAQQDIDLLDSLRDTFNANRRKLNQTDIDNIDNQVSRLARGYLSNAQIEKIASRYGSNSKGAIKEMLDVLAKTATKAQDAGRVLDDKFTIDQIKMGLIGGQKARGFKNQRQFSALTDKLPRFEIDDSGAKVGVSFGKNNPFFEPKINFEMKGEPKNIGDLLQHDKLFKQYPWVKNIKIKYAADPNASIIGQGRKGSYNPETNTITLGNLYSSEETKSTLLHEIQHAIQQKEGFARGGNPDNMALQVSPTDARDYKLVNAALEVKKLVSNGVSESEALNQVGKKNSLNPSNIREFVSDYSEKGLQTMKDNLGRYMPGGMYKRLSGELEARAVQRRMDLPASQRGQVDPYAAEAIATTGKADPSQFINRFDSEISQAVDRGSVVAKEAQDLSKQFQQNTQTLKQLNRTLADSTTEIGKDFRNVINRTDITPDVKVNILDYMRTPNRVLKKIGLGKEAELLKDKYRDYLLDLPKEIDKVTEWSKRAPDTQKVFRALDGQEVALNANEKAVVGEIRDYLKNWADKLGLPEDKRIANYITHIFEDDLIQKEFDPALARLIQDKIPGSVYDPFLQQRLGKLGYKEDAYQALDAYVKRGTRKFHMDQALGPLKKAAENLDVESEKYVKRLADRVNLRPTEVDNLIDNFIKSTPIGYKFSARPTANITRKVRQAVYRGTLGLNAGSALRNLTQGVNTYSKLGERYTIKGYIDFLTKGTEELKRVGALSDNIIQDRTPSATKKLWENIDKGLFAFFDGVEKLNRGAAYYGAKAKAINNGASEEEAIKKAIKMVEDTQFTFGSVDTPVALQSDLIKSLTQFQSFNVKQTEFLAEMIKNKELGGLMRFAGANMLMLATVGKMIGLEPKDVIPFSDVLSGESRIGQTPPIQAGSAALKSVFGDEESRQQGRKDLQRVIPAFIPGGVQTRKTIEGLGAFNEGASFTPSGRKRFDIEQTPANALRAGILGQYNTPEGREYIKNIGKSQSEILHNELKQLSPEEANARYRQIKKENPSLANQIKKRVTLDKLNATNRERDIAKITYVDGRVREVVKELNKLDTREEKNALIKRYKDLGIATDAVIDEIKKMIKEGKLK